MNKILFIFIAFFISSCGSNLNQTLSDIPSWYITPKQNDGVNLYGIAEGINLEEATKYALADAASRLMVSLSSDSTLIREENRHDFNEEMRQTVRQNFEKITFINFEITKSANFKNRFFVEVKIERNSFIEQQKEQLEIAERKISKLDKNSTNKNPLNRRDALLKISNLAKEVELKGRIIEGAEENINLKNKLISFEKFNDELEKFSDKIEFYFEINSPSEITKIIRNQLNKEKIKIAKNRNSEDPNQILIKISANNHSQKIYDFVTKVEIDFENILSGKIIASNNVEVSGHSVISEKESYISALKELEEKISKEGILKTIGILN